MNDLLIDELDILVDKIINEELEKLAERLIAPYTCQLFVKEAGKMKRYASGVLAMLSNSIYLLTALHVVEHISESNTLFVELGEDAYIELNGSVMGIKGIESRIDLGYIRLTDKQVLSLSLRYKFLTIDRFLFPNGFFQEPVYCVYGYPTQINKGISYFVKEQSKKVYDYYQLNMNDHVVLEFMGKATNIKTYIMEKVKIQHYGLSGGGVWYTVLENKGNRFKAHAYLVGIMTEFRTGKYPSLIANSINILLHAMIDSEGLKFKFNSRMHNQVKRIFGKNPSVLR
ncbi:MAG: hypothetical protein M9904_10825 [Chitinophagaceae bacterium]|nr:hypothetical protein [Chitinophagaceae bacterium]